MAKVIEVFAMKGGVGTSTASLAIAHQASKQGLRVLLVDNAVNHDICHLAGLPSESEQEWENLTIKQLSRTDKMHQYSNEFDLVVVDCGASPTDIFDEDAERVLVVRNEYVSLRNSTSVKKDRAVCFFQEGNALIENDVKMVLGTRVTFAQIDTSVSRAIDAGMFFSRSITHDWAKGFIETTTTVA